MDPFNMEVGTRIAAELHGAVHMLSVRVSGRNNKVFRMSCSGHTYYYMQPEIVVSESMVSCVLCLDDD
jgi:hypothetical protein